MAESLDDRTLLQALQVRTAALSYSLQPSELAPPYAATDPATPVVEKPLAISSKPPAVSSKPPAVSSKLPAVSSKLPAVSSKPTKPTACPKQILPAAPLQTAQRAVSGAIKSTVHVTQTAPVLTRVTPTIHLTPAIQVAPTVQVTPAAVTAASAHVISKRWATPAATQAAPTGRAGRH